MTRASKPCVCLPGYAGDACERLYKDCFEWKEGGKPGDYVHVNIQPLGSAAPLVTRCAEAKTTLAKRHSFCSANDAFKTASWQSLKTENGDCTNCCFIGLDNMYQLLNQGVNYKLSVYMNYNNGASDASVVFGNVRMTNDTGRYALTIGSSVYKSDPSIGEFLPGRQWLFCAPDYDCSGCAVSAGHAGWFSGSAPSCEDMEAFNDPIQWPFNAGPKTMNFWVMEVEPQ